MYSHAVEIVSVQVRLAAALPHGTVGSGSFPVFLLVKFECAGAYRGGYM